jgi:hypothetical protein
VKRLLYVAVVLIALALGIGIGIYAGKATEMSIEPHRLKQGYSLLTWNVRSGELCFAIVPKYKETKFVENPFSKWGAKCGISQLEEELSVLPKGSAVEWNNFSGYEYPREHIAESIVTFARSKGVNLYLNPVSDKPDFPHDELGKAPPSLYDPNAMPTP